MLVGRGLAVLDEAHAELAGAPPLTDHVAPYLRQGRMHGLLNQLLHTNLRAKGAHHILTKVERLTAASGLEGPLRELSQDLLLGPSARARDLFRQDTIARGYAATAPCSPARAASCGWC